MILRLSFFFRFLPSSCSGIVDSFTLCKAKVTNLFSSSIFNCLASCSFTNPVLISAHSAATLSQTHPRLCQLHMCFHLVWLYGSFFMSTVFVDCHPPFRASPSEHPFQSVNHRIWPLTTDPSHGSPHANNDDFCLKWQFHLRPHPPCNPCYSCVTVCPHLICFFF